MQAGLKLGILLPSSRVIETSINPSLGLVLVNGILGGVPLWSLNFTWPVPEILSGLSENVSPKSPIYKPTITVLNTEIMSSVRK